MSQYYSRESSEWEDSRHYGEYSTNVDASTWSTRPKRRKRYALKDHGHSKGDGISQDNGTNNNGADVQVFRGKDPMVEVENGDFDGHDAAGIEDLPCNDCL